MNKTLVIMAAGMGTRYGGLKQLDEVGPAGETIIDYSVYDAINAGFTKVVFIIRKDISDEFKNRIGSRFSNIIDVRYVFQDVSDIPEGYSVPSERTKPWGTGHAMLTAASEISEPFAIINADDFYGADAFIKAGSYLDQMNPSIVDAALVGFFLKNTLSDHGSVARGICSADKDGILLDVEEILGIRRKDGDLISENRSSLSNDDIVSMNMWAFSPKVLERAEDSFKRFLDLNIKAAKAEFYIPIIVNSMIKKEGTPVRVLETESEWFGVTYREDKPDVVKAIGGYIKEGIYPSPLWSVKKA